MAKPKIVIADDEKPTRDVMARILSQMCECITVPDADAAMKAVEENPDVALLITDYKMPGGDGVSLIKRVKAEHPSVACILVTAFGEIELAVERVEELQRRVDAASGIDSFTGRSPAMENVYRLIRQAAKSNANVLVEGPSGTGKELVARALHDLSPRAGGPFVAVECAALSPTLIESELFGHEKGSFTGADGMKVGKFEAADGGTLFLDEITEIDLSTQVKLLRALESRKIQRVGGNADIAVDFRLVAATNRDLAAYVRDGKFREDLYYRLNVIDIHMPALKDRPGDVALLASRFVREFSKENGGLVTGIDARAVKALEDYPWPGNVRQLRNVMEKMVVLSSGGKLTIDDVPLEIREGTQAAAPQPVAVAQALAAPARVAAPAAPSTGGSLADAERERILSALAECRNNKTKAAEVLGISRRTLHRKLKEWGMQ